MAEIYYDTVIIGAGPAGMGAAITLRKSGASVCVIDRATFPRSKTCAGLVTAKTYRLIEALFDGAVPDDLFCCTSDEVRLFRRTDQLVIAPLKRPVHLVDRIRFDNALVEEYKRLGGMIYEGEKRCSVDNEQHIVTLSNGDPIRYRYLLYADGALSASHHTLGIDRKKLAFGIEAYIPSDKLAVESVDLYFDYLDSGYVWVFPHGDRVCVGAANQYDKNTDYKKVLDTVLSDLGVSDETIKYIGAFLPYGSVIPQEKLADNILLLGDAGGFADPISGEGLYMALQSGIYAAEALNASEPKEIYLDSMETITRIIRDGKKVQKIFYAPLIQKLFYDKVRGKSGLVGHFFAEMVDEYNYEYRAVRKLLIDYQKSYGE